MVILETFINWLLIVLLAIIGVLPLFANLREPHKTKIDKKILTTMGKWFIALLFVTGLVAWGKTSMDAILHHNDDMAKEKSQNIITGLSVSHARDSMAQIIRDAECRKDAELNAANYQIALSKVKDSITFSLLKLGKKINSKADSDTKKILAKNDSINYKMASLNIVNTSNDIRYKINPKFYFDRDELNIEFWILNFGDGIAVNIESEIILIQFKNGIPFDNHIAITSSVNKSYKIYPHNEPMHTKHNFLNIRGLMNSDNLFFVINVNYKTENINKNQNIMCVYQLQSKYENKEIQSAQKDDYILIENYLKLNHLPNKANHYIS